MIKASEGGGGKGIRKALNDDEFSIGFRQVEFLGICFIFEQKIYKYFMNTSLVGIEKKN